MLYAMAAFVGGAVIVSGTAYAGGQGGQLAPQTTQATEKLDAAQLRAMVQGLGYEVTDINKEPGKEKFSVKMSTNGLDIPVGFEISPSGNYIWETVNLGDSNSSVRFEELLKQNGVIQPSFFYITSSGRLMVAQAIDNRSVNASVLKRCLDKVAADVGKTKEIWMKPAN